MLVSVGAGILYVVSNTGWPKWPPVILQVIFITGWSTWPPVILKFINNTAAGHPLSSTGWSTRPLVIARVVFSTVFTNMILRKQPKKSITNFLQQVVPGLNRRNVRRDSTGHRLRGYYTPHNNNA
ncbi:hypothetical protein PoB_006929800 [Plakobranchus ocellatus]|uniref:Uncharacterized protein n=1 Tax=Plakobranchus ocellatus TaxID=259542 RepID=A0AAV4DEZ0_9GAST|nr:hypothetical protein PoB_006929800 [Plakobranchus ocellatus]